MTFDTTTGVVATTATVVGGELTNKYSNWLNGGGSEVATIFDDDIWIVDPADSTKRIRFNADPLSTSTDVVVSVKSNSMLISHLWFGLALICYTHYSVRST